MNASHTGTIEVIARAIILDETRSQMLFCAPKSAKYFYLPGGHVEFGETATAALIREIYEETGVDVSEAEFRFAGAGENIFTQENESHHELNIYFELPGVFSGNEEVLSVEDEILFRWIPLAGILQAPVLPGEIARALSEWGAAGSINWEK